MECNSNGMIGQRGTKTNGATLSRRLILFFLEGWATKDSTLSLTAGGVPRMRTLVTRTRIHAVTIFSFAWLKTNQGEA